MKQENPISLRVTPTLRAKLDKAAKARGMSRHAFILRVLWRAVDVPVVAAKRKGTRKATKEVVPRPKSPKGGT